MIDLRAATPADLELLRYWDRQPHVIAADPNDDWAWETELSETPDWREQLIAQIDGRPIGYIEIIDPAREDSHYWGDVPGDLRAIDIWIGEAADLGKGYGTAMMRLALDRCFAPAEVTAVLVDPLASNVRAHRFYARLGFRFVERRCFGEDDCFVYRCARPEPALGSGARQRSSSMCSGNECPLSGRRTTGRLTTSVTMENVDPPKT